MTTIHDVARLAGVSIGTVSNVLNQSNKVSPKTAERVLSAVEELNYVPNTIAKSLKTNQSNHIGILAEDVGAFSSGDIIDGICEYCEKADYLISLCNLRVNRKVEHAGPFLYKDLETSETFQNSVRNSLNNLLTSRICGLIYIGVHPRDVGNILPPLDIPVVYTYAYTKNEDYCINYDDYQGARLAVDYLISQEHRRIALISGSIDSVPSHKRMLGYHTSLMEHNLQFYPEYIRTGNWHYEDGYHQCLELLNLTEPPTAIFAMSDVMAYGAINAALDRGLKVPDDISIHGFDDLELSSYTSPALTTVSLPLREMGLRTAEVMLNILKGTEEDEKGILLPCSHVERKTVAANR